MPRIALCMILTFLGGLTALLGQEPAAPGAAVSVEVRTPRPGLPVKVTAKREISVSGDSSVFARSGFEPLVLPPGELDLKTFETRGTLEVLRDGRLQKLSGLWSIAVSGTEPRASLSEREPYVVLTGEPDAGYGTEPVRAILLGKLLAGAGDDAAVNLPTGFRSPFVVRSGMRLFATGYTYEEAPDDAAMMPPGRGVEQAQHVAVYDITAGKPRLVAMAERFSEHAENNLVSAGTKDGILHMIACEVLVSDENHARVHHLRFDTLNRAWLPDDILFARSEFTSSVTPRVVAAGNSVDAFWHFDGGSTRGTTDGLYAHRIGEPATWRLYDADAEYAVLPNADGRGALLVGIATNPSGDGRIRWYLRRDDTWTTAGETNFGKTLYTLMIGGTEPFGLWRDDAGTVHAAFRHSGKLLIVDLQLPSRASLR